MKILWLCNIIMPQIAACISMQGDYGGGWLVGLSNDLVKKDYIDLTICFPLGNQKNILKGNTERLKYYSFPQKVSNPTKYNEKIEQYFEVIISEVNPDIIHIFGTEYPHTLAMINVCIKLAIINKVIINIQGLCSVISDHYYANLPRNVINSWTFRDFFKQDNIKQQRTKFVKRGQFEIEAIQKVNHVIGRTDLDKACTSQINPNATYYFCNETLRDSFYEHTWDINKCERYSIFVSQGGYPVKGFHHLLKVLPEVIKRFPHTHVYVAGSNISKYNTLRHKFHITSYGKYINQLIKKKSLRDYITFTGDLNEGAICERFLKSHVFVSSSSIENSPNSVGEAMILGIPTISSDVGGVKNMLTHNVEGYVYQHDAPYMLAYYICKIFGDDELALKYSANARVHAMKTHDKLYNLLSMKSIYEKVLFYY